MTDPSPQNPILSVKALHVGYAEKKKSTAILGPLDFALERGTCVGLVGINGSGKSTLLRSLAGLQDALSGEIRIEGKQLNTIPNDQLSKKISVVLTGQVISKNLSVLELVALGRQTYTNWMGRLDTGDKKAIEQAIEATELDHLQDKKCHTLSDGQLQRALIARALAQDTPLIILDEPTTHLDLHHKASVLALLKTIAHETDKTVLFSTHDIELVIPLCDAMIVLHDKRATVAHPQQLVKGGIFDALFPEGHVRFDREAGRFFLR